MLLARATLLLAVVATDAALLARVTISTSAKHAATKHAAMKHTAATWLRMEAPQDEEVPRFLAGEPLRMQIKSNFLGPTAGYSAVRDDMKKAFGAFSTSGDDRGKITSYESFAKLMKSVGEELSDEEARAMFDGCAALPSPSFAMDQQIGKVDGVVAFEQWVKYTLDSVREMKAENKGGGFFGLF